MLQIGTLVDNKYKIIKQLGQGGMGIVWLALNERLNRLVAIKEIQRAGTKQDEIVLQNFRKEFDIINKSRHMHPVRHMPGFLFLTTFNLCCCYCCLRTAAFNAFAAVSASSCDIYGCMGRQSTLSHNSSVTGQSAAALLVPAKAPCLCIGFL